MKTILYMAMSVNGVIAKLNDDAPWSKTIWKNYYKTSKKYGAIILGRRTYEIMKDAKEFDKIGNPYTVVLSRKKIKGGGIVLAKSPKEALIILKHRGFSEILIGGGSEVNSVFMKEGLVDEIYLDVEPVLLGRGVKLFADNSFERKLRLRGIKKLDKNTIQLHYEVLR